MVILAVLSCVEFFGDDAIPPQMSMPYNMVRVPANGHCFWSCLFLATGASEKQFLGWAQRPRNQQGFTSGNDAKAEEAAEWAAAALKLRILVVTGQANTETITPTQVYGCGEQSVWLLNSFVVDGAKQGAQHFDLITQAGASLLCEDDDAIIDAAADLPPSSDEEQVDSAIPASSVTAKAVPAPSETVQELAQCNLGYGKQRLPPLKILQQKLISREEVYGFEDFWYKKGREKLASEIEHFLEEHKQASPTAEQPAAVVSEATSQQNGQPMPLQLPAAEAVPVTPGLQAGAEQAKHGQAAETNNKDVAEQQDKHGKKEKDQQHKENEKKETQKDKKDEEKKAEKTATAKAAASATAPADSSGVGSADNDKNIIADSNIEQMKKKDKKQEKKEAKKKDKKHKEKEEKKAEKTDQKQKEGKEKKTQRRRHLEEVQERVTVKRQRSDRSLEDVKETHISLDLKAKKLTQDLEAYTAVLGKLTSADRQEKDPSASWSCHFNDLLQQDLTDAPLLFSDSQLPYLDMIVELSKHISCLTKEKNKVEHSAARALKVFNAKCQSHQKTVNRLKRKVEKVFHGNTEETLEKNKRLHTVEKRRRQQYHAFRGHALKKHGNQRKNRKRQYKTIDNGVFTEQLRVPRRVVSIEQKLKVLDRYEEMLATKKSAAEDALEPRPRGAGREAVLAWSKKRKQAKRRMRFDSLKKLREEFPDIVGKAQPSKWKKAAESEAWRELPEFFRARSSATTNSWRRKLGLPLKGRPEGGCVPLQIQRELDTLMMEFSSGLSSVSERKELVTVEHIAETAASLISDWNSSLPDRAAMVQSFNEDLETKYKNGEMHAEAVVEAYHPLPREIAVPSMAWIRQWKASWGWSMLTRGSDDASYLPYNHVDMQMSRQRTLDLIHKKGVHKFLLLNFDQVWRNNWNMAKFKLAFKDRVNIGRKGNKAQIGPREDKKLHHIRGSRQSMTVLTSSWSDGRPGPVAFCVAEGKLRPADIQKWNAEHVGSSLIISSQTPTHFMNAESLIVVLEQLYSPAFEAQRKRYNLSAHDRGALLADAWTGTFSQAAGMNLRRHTWYERHNIEPPVVQPGGWSTHGQPVDSMHAAYRQGIRKKDLASTGHCANLRERARYETLDLKASGQVAASVKPVIDIIKISYDAWRELDRRVFIAAWMITGYFSADHFPQDTSAEQVEHMEHAKTIIDPCVYHPLPYELAHAVVRTVALHGTAFLDAQQEYESCKEADPKEKLAKTKKAKEQLMGLHSADRFSVLNRRTGWVATSEWMTKHMVIVDGKPQPKVNSNTPKSKAWILAVRITIVGGNVELKLQPSEGKSFRRVRCLSLENGLEKAKLHSLAEGYAHVLDAAPIGDAYDAGEDVECVDDAGSIDMEGEEASEDESVLGDEAGLEGQVKTHMENLQMDPAPTTKAGEDTQSKVWAPSSSNMMQPSVIAEAPIDPLVEGPADGEFIDESNMIQMHGHKQPGGSSHSHTPPGFFEREAYADLEKVGLTALPMADGYVLSYHKVTRQWHARDPSGSNYAPTWGLIRSELKALLLALDQLWDWYVETNPDDKVDAEEHLQNIRSYSNSIPF
ncbi:unnamed protein product [Durusdinium trenchii]|uniref:Uncharacterized protein n=1 Tax=Durusdinium trenchii TaxID=1381693 RepID=A0ABP0QEN4_9DINO